MAPRHETVKGLSWKLLYGNYRGKIGTTAWDAAIREVGGPDVVAIDGMDDVPMAPFNAMLHAIDRLVGRGTGSEIDRVAQESVKGWANFNKNLVKQLQGRPDKMMEVFANEVHPFFLADPDASRVAGTPGQATLKGSDGGIDIELPNSLDRGFKVGLLRGFVELTGAHADIRHIEGHRFRVLWTLPDHPAGDPVARFVNAVRAPFLTAAIIPVLVGWAVAWGDGHFDTGLASQWGFLVLTLVAVAFFHLGANAINDYFDHKSGADEANYTPTPFSGGSRLIQRGLMEPAAVRNVAIACYGLGTVLGLTLIGALMATGQADAWKLGLFGLAGFLIGFLYTAPPVRLAHHGFGELAVALAFGPLVVVGTWAVFSADFDPAAWTRPLVASAPVALLVAAILYVNQFPDKAGDAAVGKRTLTVRLGDRANLWLFSLIVLAAYGAVVAGVMAELLPAWSLLALLTLPLALWTLRKVAKDHDHPYKLIPANAATILGLHLGTGVLLITGLTVAAL